MSMAAILAAILDFEKATLNFNETLRTIEKSKETIVKRPNKVMGLATGLSVIVTYKPVA